MLDVSKVLFNVEADRKVSLCLGPVGITVCDTPEEFEDFIQALVSQLNTIHDELKEYHME